MSQSTVRRTGLFSYENGLLAILSIAFGITFFDRTAATILMPQIIKDLHFNNLEISMISSGLSLTWALGAYLFGRWSDHTGVRKPFLLAFLVVFSSCSFLSGLAQNFPQMLGLRMIMGLTEGPFLPVCLAIMAVESSPSRRGINAGIMQNFMSAILGQSLVPLLLVPFGLHFGWRSSFYLAGVPGILCALAVLAWVREPSKEAQASVDREAVGGEGPRMGLLEMLKTRNIFLCCAVAVFMVPWLLLGIGFFPTFFTNDLHLGEQTMSYLMAGLGLSSAVSSCIFPALSDKFGRRAVMIGSCATGVLAPLAVLFFHGPVLALGVILFIGWGANGAFPLFMGVIPGETISRRYAATAMGLVVFVGEVFGGVGIVTGSGRLADVFGRPALMLVMAGLAVVGTLLSTLLVETAPAKRLARTVSVEEASQPTVA